MLRFQNSTPRCGTELVMFLVYNVLLASMSWIVNASACAAEDSACHRYAQMLLQRGSWLSTTAADNLRPVIGSNSTLDEVGYEPVSAILTEAVTPRKILKPTVFALPENAKVVSLGSKTLDLARFAESGAAEQDYSDLEASKHSATGSAAEGHVFSVSVSTSDNLGDNMSPPHLYFSDLGSGHQSVDIARELPLSSGDTVIIGGGNLMAKDYGWYDKILGMTQVDGANVIGWGLGAQLVSGSRPTDASMYSEAINGFNFIGLRDYGVDGFADGRTNKRWVPCASCMSPIFDEVKYNPTHRDVGVYEHMDVKVDPAYKAKVADGVAKKNDNPNLRDVLSYLASSEVVVTTSFHGAYWATLLGKKVIVCSEGRGRVKSSFYSLKHTPTFCTGDVEADIAAAKRYPEALEESRKANRDFYELVKGSLDAR